MTRREQLLYLLEAYCGGRTPDFSSHMARIFHIERDDSLSPEENAILAPLAHTADYFSPSPKDHAMYAGFTTEEDVKTAAQTAYQTLLTRYGVESFEGILADAVPSKEDLCG